MARPPRYVLPLVGPPARTRALALARLGDRLPDEVIWVSSHPEAGPFTAVAPSSLRKELGRSGGVLVLDLHDGLHADLLAAAPGFLHAGGTLVLRLGHTPVPPEHLAVHPSPWIPRAPGTRLEERLRSTLTDALAPPSGPLPAAVPATAGSREQRALVHALTHALDDAAPAIHTVVARRGRGKSTALGMVLGQAHRSGLRVALCAPDPAAATVALATAEAPLTFLTPEQAVDADGGTWDVLAVDEAARMPVPWLLALARRHRGTLLFATTTGGYEGTGKGFVLRFLASLRDDPRPLHRHVLHTPIRWEQGDPVEDWLDRLLLDDATPPPRPARRPPLTLEAVGTDRLTTDDALLEQVYGLLQHAHYRTTPADRQRLLDGPNLALHVAREGATVLAVNLVALEGGLPPDVAEGMRGGRLRVRGHALPDTLTSHMGAVEAASWTWLRSVRLAVHPERRREGLATQLTEHVHGSWQVDGFGTLFGAVAHVVRMRQGLGYHLVRLGASRGSRTGEPSAVMVRPVTPRAEALVHRLVGRTARDLDLTLELLHGDGQLPLEPDLLNALRRGLPPPLPLTEDELVESVHAYVHGPRPLEAAATALRAWLGAPTTDLSRWTTVERQLADDRLSRCRSWDAAARRAELPHARAAMRALKRACRRLDPP